MKIDTEQLFHAVNSDLAAVNRALDLNMFPQVRENQRQEQRDLRAVKDAIAVVERYALNRGDST